MAITLDHHSIEPERRAPIESVKGLCGIPARLSGFVSLIIQLIVVIVASVLTALLFFHVGGYDYFVSANLNETDIGDDFPTPLPLNASLDGIPADENVSTHLLRTSKTF
jgi:hypothetical protein